MDAFTWDQWLFAGALAYLLFVLPLWSLVERLLARRVPADAAARGRGR